MTLRFEWEQDKASRSVRKHAIAFAEASTLFTSGVDYLEIFDVEHSVEDERFICIGPIARGIVVVVTMDVDIDVIRIIPARLAPRREPLLYADFWRGAFQWPLTFPNLRRPTSSDRFWPASVAG